MKRRDLIAMLGGAAVAWPLAATAESKRARIAYLASSAGENSDLLTTAFVDGLGEFGYVAGHNIDIEFRYASSDLGRLPALVDDLLRFKPDVIVTNDPPAALAVWKATKTIPIVSLNLNDPMRLGLVASYARPGGNVTGIASLVENLPGKQVEIARELVPGLVAIGVLENPDQPTNVYQRNDIDRASTAHAIKVVAADIRTKADLKSAFETFGATGVQVVIVLRDFLLSSERVEIVQRAAASRLPLISAQYFFVNAGAIVSYGINDYEAYHHAAVFVDRILKGANPGDLPVEFPTKLVMWVNLKTARALGVTIPPTLLARADEVIE